MRAAIWIIVGILVIAGVIFFIVARSQNAKLGGAATLTAETIKKTADRELKKTEEYLADNKKLQAALASAGKLNDAAKVRLAELESKVNQLKEKAQALQTATGKTADEIGKDIANLTKEYNRIKRDLKKGK